MVLKVSCMCATVRGSEIGYAISGGFKLVLEVLKYSTSQGNLNLKDP